ncbi:transmembrane protein, putative [Medicago truncatula]|uniref:Transmembrane protein, putative n=1 Tax=Medicago truncatula TaxID=3880 RepID=G7LBU5_MEDTR|nr:transmembrane protein, putative [Medicago truncatula]
MKWKHAIQKFIQPEDSAGRALCELESETSTHLFLFCVVDRGVWNLVLGSGSIINFCLCFPAAILYFL